MARPHLDNPVARRRISGKLSFVTVPRLWDLRHHNKNRRSLKTFPPPRLCPSRLRSKPVSDYATNCQLAASSGETTCHRGSGYVAELEFANP